MRVLGRILLRRPDLRGWRFLPALGVLAFFILLGAHHGLRAVLHMVVVFLAALLSIRRPTLLGWAVVVLWFVLYVASVVAVPLTGRDMELDDFLFFLVSGATPAVLLLAGRPRARLVTDRVDIPAALVLALLVVAPVYIELIVNW